jgi:hypothetical protein
MQRSTHCQNFVTKPAQRIEVVALPSDSEPRYAVFEVDEDDSMRWLRSAHQSAHEAAYAAAQFAVRAGLPLWFPHVEGQPNPLVQALEDVLFAEGVIAYCTQQPDTLWHPVQYTGYAAAAARYPELAVKGSQEAEAA